MDHDLRTCETCGAAVADSAQHRAWHASLTRAASEAELTRDELDHLVETLAEDDVARGSRIGSHAVAPG